MNATMVENSVVSVLLVEDDDIDALAVERAFRQQKMTNPLQRAHDGIEAMRLLQAQEVTRPYLILLDLNMPRMNGLELLGALRQDTKLADSVVFVLTTSRSDQDIAGAYSRHVAGYMLKQNLRNGFLDVACLLDHYWRIVVLPS